MVELRKLTAPNAPEVCWPCGSTSTNGWEVSHLVHKSAKVPNRLLYKLDLDWIGLRNAWKWNNTCQVKEASGCLSHIEPWTTSRKSQSRYGSSMYIYNIATDLNLEPKYNWAKKFPYLEPLCLEPTNLYLEHLCLEPNNNTQVITHIIYIKDLKYLLAETYT